MVAISVPATPAAQAPSRQRRRSHPQQPFASLRPCVPFRSRPCVSWRKGGGKPNITMFVFTSRASPLAIKSGIIMFVFTSRVSPLAIKTGETFGIFARNQVEHRFMLATTLRLLCSSLGSASLILVLFLLHEPRAGWRLQLPCAQQEPKQGKRQRHHVRHLKPGRPSDTPARKRRHGFSASIESFCLCVSRAHNSRSAIPLP